MARSEETFLEYLIRKEKEIKKRPEILPAPVPIYEHTYSEIPERVRISFSNGTSAIYDLHTEQPAPVVLENVKIIQRMVGYEPKHARRGRE